MVKFVVLGKRITTKRPCPVLIGVQTTYQLCGLPTGNGKYRDGRWVCFIHGPFEQANLPYTPNQLFFSDQLYPYRVAVWDEKDR